MSHTGRAARTVLFWTLAVLLLTAQVVVLCRSVGITRLWEDEAFNLTVPLNLLRGLGYASDGVLSGSEITLFDPRISTGPVVLLPIAAVLTTGIDTVVGARLVVAAFYVALLVGLGMVGHRIGGRWAMLIAVAVPLTLDTAASISPIQGPADILGEIPAAALCVWAAIALRRRPWLAALLLGLAIQSKYISALFLPSFAVAMWMQMSGAPWRARVKRLAALALLVGVPTVVVETVALIALGPAGYVRHIRETAYFLRSGGQAYAPNTPGEKLATLAAHWFLPTGIAIAIAIVAVGVGVAAVLTVRRDPGRLEALRARAGAGAADRAELGQIAIITGVGLVVFIGWWALAAHTPLWIRHPSPALFALTPIVAAFLIVALRLLGGWVSAVGGTLLVALLALQISAHMAQAFAPPWETLADQRAVAAEVARLGHPRVAVEWGGPVSIAVLSGARVGLWDAGAAVADWPRLLNGNNAACVAPRVDIRGYAMCAAASAPKRESP